MLEKEIANRIRELGGTCDFKGKSLKEDLLSISFKRPFVQANDLYSIVTEYDIPTAKEIHKEMVETGSVPECGTICTIEFLNSVYTFEMSPYEADEDEDCEEAHTWKAIVSGTDVEINPRELMMICAICGHDFLTFVCLTDENPSNPTVYDFETASCQDRYETMEISGGYGTLEDFLNTLLTPEEFETIIDKTNGLYEAYQNKTLDYKGVYEALNKICSS